MRNQKKGLNYQKSRSDPYIFIGFPDKFFQGFPAATAEIGEQLSVIEEIPSQDFGYAEEQILYSQKESDPVIGLWLR